jgi:hypothetical protein
LPCALTICTDPLRIGLEQRVAARFAFGGAVAELVAIARRRPFRAIARSGAELVLPGST